MISCMADEFIFPNQQPQDSIAKQSTTTKEPVISLLDSLPDSKWVGRFGVPFYFPKSDISNSQITTKIRTGMFLRYLAGVCGLETRKNG